MACHYGKQSFAPLERKDEGGSNSIEQTVAREIKQFGDDVKALKDSMQHDLAEVRTLAEEAKGAAESPEVKRQIDALTTSVTEKQAALEAKLSGRLDEIETAMSRTPTGGGTAEERKAAVDRALKFYEAKKAATGDLNWRNRPDAESADLDGYALWEAKFGDYLRVDDRGMNAPDEVKALSVGSNPNGGYLVPTARSNRIIGRIYETSPLRQLATVETIGTESLEIPVDTDQAGYGWVGEEEARPETASPTTGVQTIPVHEMYAKPRVTQKFLEDAAITPESWLAMKIADRFARAEATAFVTGDGVKKPRGILSYPHGAAGARSTILQVNSGHATQITADAVVGMPFELKAEYLANARWLAKRSTVRAVMLLKDNDGQYLWRPGLTEGQPQTLCGYAIMMADDMPALAAGSLSMAFGDFRRGYTVVDRLGITTLRDPYSAKPFVEFYSRKRVGGDVVDFEAFALMKTAA